MNINSNPFNDISFANSYGTYGKESVSKMVNLLKDYSLTLDYNGKEEKFTINNSASINKETIEKIFSQATYSVWKPKILNDRSQSGNLEVQLTNVNRQEKQEKILIPTDLMSTPASKCKGEIAEALQSEVAFTIATDKKYIIATYGAGPCIALAGYDPTNKIAFVAHFANKDEIAPFDIFFSYIMPRLMKKNLEEPIQIHLRGGREDESEDILKSIKNWIEQKKDFTMEIKSVNVLGPTDQSLSINAKNGEVSQYDPMSNPNHRNINKAQMYQTLLSAFEPDLKLAYYPYDDSNDSNIQGNYIEDNDIEFFE